MSFKVNPDDLEGYGRMIARAGDDVREGRDYLNRHTEVPSTQQGLFTRPFDLHGSLEDDVERILNRLHSLLDASSVELDGSADYYRKPDLEEAVRMDALLPKSNR